MCNFLESGPSVYITAPSIDDTNTVADPMYTHTHTPVCREPASRALPGRLFTRTQSVPGEKNRHATCQNIKQTPPTSRANPGPYHRLYYPTQETEEKRDPKKGEKTTVHNVRRKKTAFNNTGKTCRKERGKNGCVETHHAELGVVVPTYASSFLLPRNNGI
jgi:hypothetical protein